MSTVICGRTDAVRSAAHARSCRCSAGKLFIWLCTAAFLPIAASAEPAMWVIRDQDSTIYLIGTAHLLRHEVEWNSPKLKKAFADSSELWLEVPDPEDTAAVIPLIQQYGMDKEKPLSQKLSVAQNEKLEKAAAEYGITKASLDPMRPWMVGMMFATLPLVKAGYDPNAGVDLILEREAKKKGEKILGFETLEEQMRFLAELPEAEQIAFLDQTLDDVAEGLAKTEKIATAWINGDSVAIAGLLVTELNDKAPTLYKKLIVDRNIRWATKVEAILRGSGVQLIAVGAAHLVGADSVQAQLTKRGIKSETY
jgi:uncharacterized protein YbaP (TraB family)